MHAHHSPLPRSLRFRDCKTTSIPIFSLFAQEMQSALTRGLKLVTQCATQGPFYSLLHDGEISSEFVNCAIELGQALAKAGGSRAGSSSIRGTGS